METYMPVVGLIVFSTILMFIGMLGAAHLGREKKDLKPIIVAGVSVLMLVTFLGSMYIRDHSRGRLIPGLEANAIYVTVREYPQREYPNRRVLELYDKNERTFHYLVECVQSRVGKADSGVVQCPEKFPQTFQVVQDSKTQKIVELKPKAISKSGN